jgi:hypothetical protein
MVTRHTWSCRHADSTNLLPSRNFQSTITDRIWELYNIYVFPLYSFLSTARNPFLLVSIARLRGTIDMLCLSSNSFIMALQKKLLHPATSKTSDFRTYKTESCALQYSIKNQLSFAPNVSLSRHNKCWLQRQEKTFFGTSVIKYRGISLTGPLEFIEISFFIGTTRWSPSIVDSLLKTLAYWEKLSWFPYDPSKQNFSVVDR